MFSFESAGCPANGSWTASELGKSAALAGNAAKPHLDGSGGNDIEIAIRRQRKRLIGSQGGTFDSRAIAAPCIDQE
jgi:hypothetical protein